MQAGGKGEGEDWTAQHSYLGPDPGLRGATAIIRNGGVSETSVWRDAGGDKCVPILTRYYYSSGGPARNEGNTRAESGRPWQTRAGQPRLESIYITSHPSHHPQLQLQSQLHFSRVVLEEPCRG